MTNLLGFYLDDGFFIDCPRNKWHTRVQPERLFDATLQVFHVCQIFRRQLLFPVAPGDLVELLLHLLLHVLVEGQQVDGEGHVGGRRVVALEHEGVHFFSDVLVGQVVTLGLVVEEEVEESQTFLFANGSIIVVLFCSTIVKSHLNPLQLTLRILLR